MGSRFVVKIGDVVSDRGIVGGPFYPNVRVNDIPLAMPGSSITPHLCCGSPGCDIHCAATVLSGSVPNILVNGVPIVVAFTDPATCGEPVNRQSKPSLVLVT